MRTLLICLTLLFPTSLHADVTLSAAISLKPALEKAQPLLEKAAGDKIVFNFGASGTLAGQIQQGAPVDLFLSADRPTAQKLLDSGAAEKASDHVIAGNALVLISSPLSSTKLPAPADFSAAAKFPKLAIGDPKIVPAGSYAKEALTSLKLWDDLDKSQKLVTAENVAQVLTYVRRGDVPAGIVYATDAKATPSVTILATADPSLHSPIEYISVLIAKSPHHAAAQKIQHALLEQNTQSLLHDLGFTPPPPEKSPPK